MQTERSIRFALWNNEETGLNGARAYVEQRKDAAGQGGSRRARAGIPEPKWLGMIQHDMMMFDHGMPRADGTVSPEQRPEADVNIEFQSTAKMADEAQKLAWFVPGGQREVRHRLSGRGRPAHDQHRLDAVHGSRRRRSACARTSAARRSAAAGIRTGTSRPTSTRRSRDKDFRLGLNAAQTTLAAVAQLTGATVKK